jgi:hypothetical protein
MNRAQTIESLKLLGLIPLSDGDGNAVTMARDEGRHDAFRIRVHVPNDGRPALRINGRVSDARDVVDAVRQFLKVVRS